MRVSHSRPYDTLIQADRFTAIANLRADVRRRVVMLPAFASARRLGHGDRLF